MMLTRIEAHSRTGADPIVFCKGDRVTWKNPGGLGGTEVSGVFMGGCGSLLGGYVVGIDADPSESLRKIVVGELSITTGIERRALAETIGIPHSDLKCGLDGNGGPIILTGEAFESAVQRGDLYLDPLPTPNPKEPT